jgi:hypothetical protein
LGSLVWRWLMFDVCFFPTENAIIEIIVHTVDTENVRGRNLEFLEFLEFLAGHARWIFQRTTSPLRP